MGPPTRSGYDKKLDTAERMAMKLANPESRTFENYLGKVMKSVQPSNPKQAWFLIWQATLSRP